MTRIVVQHVITSLGTGGAERMLERIVRCSAQDIDHRVITLRSGGALEERVRDAGAVVESLGIGEEFIETNPVKAAELLRSRGSREDVVVGWLHHGNLAAGIRSHLVGAPSVMNFRGIFGHERDRFVLRLLRPLARRASLRLANSHEAVAELGRYGFGEAAFLPNGFDPTAFFRDEVAGARVRSALSVRPSELLVGSLGRAHAMKGHREFLRALTTSPAGVALRRARDLVFVVAGRGVPEECAEFVGAQGRGDCRVILLDEHRDVVPILSALDVYAHPSLTGEGFPNVVAEAMLCELPVVANDVAETRSVLGVGNVCVAAGAHNAFVAGLRRFTAEGSEFRRVIGTSNRAHVVARYSIDDVAGRYVNAFTSVVGTRRACVE